MQIEHRESPYFETHPNLRGDCRPWDAYAPLPVFLSVWEEDTLDESITNIEWNWGDGTIDSDKYLRNASHVYTVPGRFAVTCIKTFEDGETVLAAHEINVREPDGETYFVSPDGNDNNNGLTPEYTWRTAEKAFSGLNENRYGPGDQILFERGGKYPAGSTQINHYRTGYGFCFGAYGEGDRPVITSDGSAGNVLSVRGHGACYFSFNDIDLDLDGRGFWYSSMFLTNILFRNMKVRNAGTFCLLSQGTAHNNAWNVQHNNIDMYGSKGAMMYINAWDYSCIDCNFEYAANHIVYGNFCERGLIKNSVFHRPAANRAAYRMCDGGVNNTKDGHLYHTNKVIFLDNEFTGWVDDRTYKPERTSPQFSNGRRWNYRLVDFTPNTGGDLPQELSDYIFANNKVWGGEMLIGISSATDFLVVENEFGTDYDPTVDPAIGYKIVLGDSYDRRGIKNVRIARNTMFNPKKSWSMIGVLNESYPFNNIEVTNNVVDTRDAKWFTLKNPTNDLSSIITVEENNLQITPGQLMYDFAGVKTDIDGGRAEGLDVLSTVTGDEPEVYMVEVPNLLGLALDDILVENLSLKLGSVNSIYNEAPEGHIIQQSPPPGKMVPEGSVVNVITSLGIEMVEMPDVLNLSLEEAEKAIQDAGLYVETITSEYSPTIPFDHIMGQGPVPHKLVEKGFGVILIRSMGVELVDPLEERLTALEAKVNGTEEAILTNVARIDVASGDAEDLEYQVDKLEADSTDLGNIVQIGGIKLAELAAIVVTLQSDLVTELGAQNALIKEISDHLRNTP